MAVTANPRRLLAAPGAEDREVDPNSDARDHRADERDHRAEERDHRAEERDHRAEERDREAAVNEQNQSIGRIDLRDRRVTASLRHQGAAERRHAASDRRVAATDRAQAGMERRLAASERGDAHEEREIFLRDQLTGVLQRGAGLIALEGEAARSSRSGQAFVLAFLDVDGLKRINDQHGHGTGDTILRTVGQTLLASMRSYDFVLRYGGDEFVCILPGANITDAEARFDVVQAALLSGRVPVSVTVGLAEWRSGEDTDDLLARADAALYEKRRNARSGEPAAQA